MLGRTNTGGGSGGGGLNFTVVGGTTAPNNPKENTIWVNTSTKITDWVFSATQPTGSAGMVWITIGTSSTVAFSATKKNPIMVYPISAKQYVGGAWVDKTAKSYQGGEWVEWVVYLYGYGYEYTNITGGWTTDGFKYRDRPLIPQAFSKGADYLGFDKTSNYTSAGTCCAACKNKINLTDYSRIVVIYKNTYLDPTDKVGVVLDISTSTDLSTGRVGGISTAGAVGVLTTESLKIEGLSGAYYIGFHSSTYQGGNVYGVYLAR